MGRDSTFQSALDGGSFGPTPDSRDQRLETEGRNQSFLCSEAPIRSLGWEGFWALNRRKSRDSGAPMAGAPSPSPTPCAPGLCRLPLPEVSPFIIRWRARK